MKKGNVISDNLVITLRAHYESSKLKKETLFLGSILEVHSCQLCCQGRIFFFEIGQFWQQATKANSSFCFAGMHHKS